MRPYPRRTLLTLAVLLASRPALAHARLKSASPPPGAELDRAPALISITFSEALEPRFSGIAVTDAVGISHTAGPAVAGAEPQTLQVPLIPLPPGTYLVAWRATSTDTHHTEGSYRFTVRA